MLRALVVTSLLLVGVGPQVAPRQDLSERSALQKAEGETETYMLQTEFAGRTIMFILAPSEEKTGPTHVLESALQLDNETGMLSPWKLEDLLSSDNRGGITAAADDGGGGCAANNCGGACCVISVGSKVCVLCTCCDAGTGNCTVSLFVCFPAA